MKKTITLLGLSLLLTVTTANAELIQQFKDPTFSGNGWASQVLTLEQMRNSAQNSLDSKAAADKAAIDAAAANTPLAKFMALFTGQVYSQLATQLSNNLFKECTGSSCAAGDFNVSATQQIHWDKVGSNVTLMVYNGKLQSDGTTFVRDSGPAAQIITVPVSSFSF